MTGLSKYHHQFNLICCCIFIVAATDFNFFTLDLIFLTFFHTTLTIALPFIALIISLNNSNLFALSAIDMSSSKKTFISCFILQLFLTLYYLPFIIIIFKFYYQRSPNIIIPFYFPHSYHIYHFYNSWIHSIS